MDFLRYGLIGRPVMRIASAGDMSVLRLIVLLLSLAFLIVFIAATAVNWKNALILGIPFLLLFGYLMAIGLAIVGGFILLLGLGGGGDPTSDDSRRKQREEEKTLSPFEIDSELSEMDKRAYKALEPFQDYGAYKRHRATIRTRKDLRNFRDRWEGVIYRNS